jgi:hypothetical protein
MLLPLLMPIHRLQLLQMNYLLLLPLLLQIHHLLPQLPPNYLLLPLLPLLTRHPLPLMQQKTQMLVLWVHSLPQLP